MIDFKLTIGCRVALQRVFQRSPMGRDGGLRYVAYAWADHAIRWIEQAKRDTVLFYEKLLDDGA